MVFDACINGCEQKRATRVRRFPFRWFRRLAVCCDGQHVHKFECANNVDNFITRSQYPVALCHVLVDIMDSHCLVVRLAPPPSASSRLVDDIRISAGVRQRERRRPLLLPEFKEVVSNSINKTLMFDVPLGPLVLRKGSKVLQMREGSGSGSVPLISPTRLQVAQWPQGEHGYLYIGGRHRDRHGVTSLVLS